MNEISVNKPFVSRLGWTDLDSVERTAVMDLIRTIDELRQSTNDAEVTLEACIKATRESAIQAVQEMRARPLEEIENT